MPVSAATAKGYFAAVSLSGAGHDESLLLTRQNTSICALGRHIAY
jgi:hypothetical protein